MLMFKIICLFEQSYTEGIIIPGGEIVISGEKRDEEAPSWVKVSTLGQEYKKSLPSKWCIGTSLSKESVIMYNKFKCENNALRIFK